MFYHIQGEELNYARASKDKYNDKELFDQSDDDCDNQYAVMYAGKNVANGDMDEIEDKRKMPALPAALPADVGRKQSTSSRKKKKQNCQ